MCSKQNYTHRPSNGVVRVSECVLNGDRELEMWCVCACACLYVYVYACACVCVSVCGVCPYLSPEVERVRCMRSVADLEKERRMEPPWWPFSRLLPTPATTTPIHTSLIRQYNTHMISVIILQICY